LRRRNISLRRQVLSNQNLVRGWRINKRDRLWGIGSGKSTRAYIKEQVDISLEVGDGSITGKKEASVRYRISIFPKV
jgi:hypothetical protein